MIIPAVAVLAAAVLVMAVRPAIAQSQSEGDPKLPPAPTPTALYPGSSTSSYPASGTDGLVAWQTLYLPIHSQAKLPERSPRAASALAIVVSIHNPDPDTAIRIHRIRHHGANGRLLGTPLEQPVVVAALGNTNLSLPGDSAGHSALVIEWNAERPVNPPLVEALHYEGQRLMFATEARVVRTR